MPRVLADRYLIPLTTAAKEVGLDHLKWSCTAITPAGNRGHHFNSGLVLFSPGKDIRIHIRMVCAPDGGSCVVPYSDEVIISRMTAAIKTRTRGSGYANLESIRFNSSAMSPHKEPGAYQDEIVKLFQAYAKHVKQHEVKGAPKALTFKDTDITHVGHDYVRNTSQIASCRVMRLVNIRDLRFIEILDANALSTPDVKPWFLMDCGGFQGACFSIITDGDVFHPSSRVTTTMLASNLPSQAQPFYDKRSKRVRIVSNCDKRTVDLTKATSADKRLINAAIETWVEHFV